MDISQQAAPAAAAVKPKAPAARKREWQGQALAAGPLPPSACAGLGPTTPKPARRGRGFAPVLRALRCTTPPLLAAPPCAAAAPKAKAAPKPQTVDLVSDDDEPGPSRPAPPPPAGAAGVPGEAGLAAPAAAALLLAGHGRAQHGFCRQHRAYNNLYPNPPACCRSRGGVAAGAPGGAADHAGRQRQHRRARGRRRGAAGPGGCRGGGQEDLGHSDRQVQGLGAAPSSLAAQAVAGTLWLSLPESH